MDRANLFALTLAICVVNGIFSPFVQLVARASLIWAPTWLPDGPGALFYLSSLVVSTTTLMVAGVPAALLERVAPGLRGSAAPMWVWIAAALFLSVPALVRMLLMSGAVA
ncbi:MAG: hypothetical protein IPK81_07700 [Rhodospirillales bacterium]|nr:MAG: hypothetical protein IPK81_07700 [Rhodospirillales bacterium]